MVVGGLELPKRFKQLQLKKVTGPTSNQPLRRSSRIAEKRKFVAAEEVGSNAKKFAGDVGKNTKWKIGENLYDGVKISIDEALDAAEDFLGSGYKDMGKGRFISADGIRQVRMTDSDLKKIGNHAGSPHMNFEYLISNPEKPGKIMPDPKRNYHIFLEE